MLIAIPPMYAIVFTYWMGAIGFDGQVEAQVARRGLRLASLITRKQKQTLTKN